MKKAIQIITLYFKLSAVREMAYRANFFVQIIHSVVELTIAMGGLAIVFSHTDTLGGWTPSELIALVGVYMTVGGIVHFVIEPSLALFMQDVRLGTLDFVLTKPVDSQLIVSIRRFQLWKAADILLGFGVITVALVRTQTQMSLLQLLDFTFILLMGGVTVYSFWLMLATSAIWFVKTENLFMVFESMFSAGRWPITLYPLWLRMTLTFVVPIAFAVTVPTQALIGQLTAVTRIQAIALAILLASVSRWFWLRGLRSYSGASA